MSKDTKLKEIEYDQDLQKSELVTEFIALELPHSTATLEINTSSTLAPDTQTMTIPEKDDLLGTEEKLEILLSALRRNPNFEYEGPPVENLTSIELSVALNKIKLYEKNFTPFKTELASATTNSFKDIFSPDLWIKRKKSTKSPFFELVEKSVDLLTLELSSAQQKIEDTNIKSSTNKKRTSKNPSAKPRKK